MKFFTPILCFVALFFATSSLSAKEISRTQAVKVAQNFYYEVTASKNFSPHRLQIVETFTELKDGVATFYAFNFQDGGFVIVSADDVYTPIIGYNTEFRFDNHDLPVSLQSFFDSYSEQILEAKNRTETSAYADQWTRLLSDDRAALNTQNRDAVLPLGAPIWNQDYPFNYYCPSSSDGRTYAGCVATAMHMIMYYWRWPFVGEGDNGYHWQQYGYLYADFANSYYDWDGMPYEPKGFYPEISKMMYHIGIAVDMMYGTDGSGAYSEDVPEVMMNHFKFKSGAQFHRRQYYSGDWTQFLKDELNAHRMLYFSGCSNSGCHAFVCEGYTADDYFYFNLGWSGQNNGYYTLEHVGGYGRNQGALVGLEPDEAKGYPYYCSGLRTVILQNGTISDGSGPIADYLPNTSAAWLIDPEAGGVPVKDISVTWRSLDLAEGSFLRFYDGNSTNSPLLAEFTHGDNSQSFKTTGNQLYVSFESGSATANGFNFEYTSKIIRTCSGVVTYTQPEGTFDDGSEEGRNYAPNSQCMFVIEPGNGEPLNIQFTRFQLADDGFDNVSIYNLYTNTDYRLIAELKGHYGEDEELPNVHVSSGRALIMFNTNNIDNDKGWELTWQSAVGIDEMEPMPNVVVSPNPATNHLNIHFNVEQLNDITLQLYNLTGQLIYNEDIRNFSGNYNNTINVETLTSGVYILKIKTLQGTIGRKVVIE